MPPVPDGGRRLALLLATSVYSDPDLRQLRAPGRDAAELAEVLRDQRIGGFDVQILVNATSSEVQEGIEDFCADRSLDDHLLIYLSCHGVLDSNGRLYYTASNTRRQRLAATAVAAGWLNERLDDCRARRQILVLDCCHSGAFARGAKGDSELALQARFEPHGRGRVVLTASRSTEYSFEGGQASGEGVPSVFTDAIVTGLRTGDADRDKDGLITVTDLYQYVYEHVRVAEPRQNPELWTYGAEGSLVVANSVRGPVIEPEPLPEDLRIALESPRRRVRETGVAELAELLDTGRPSLELAARHALKRVAEEDHPQVATLAGIAVEAPTGAAADHVRREVANRINREQQQRQEVNDQGGRQETGQARRAVDYQAPPAPAQATEQHAARKNTVEQGKKSLAQPVGPLAPARARPPRIALSSQAMDFGRLQADDAPRQRRIRISNAGSDLNVRIASAPSWIHAEHNQGTLTLTPDLKNEAPGSLTGNVLLDSDAGSATIRVTAMVDPPGIRDPHDGDRFDAWYLRIGALVIDILALAPGIILWTWGTQWHWSGGPTIGILITTAVWLYNRCWLQSRTGQSVGKRITSLKLIFGSRAEDESQFVTAGLRDVLNFLTIFVLGFMFPLWTAQGQTLADLLADTVVIPLKAKPSQPREPARLP